MFEIKPGDCIAAAQKSPPDTARDAVIIRSIFQWHQSISGCRHDLRLERLQTIWNGLSSLWPVRNLLRHGCLEKSLKNHIEKSTKTWVSWKIYRIYKNNVAKSNFQWPQLGNIGWPLTLFFVIWIKEPAGHLDKYLKYSVRVLSR